MKKSDFYFALPDKLIAQYPLEKRTDSRLLAYNCSTKQLTHNYFHQLPTFLQPNDLLVMNNTRVIPARLYGYKATGGKVELLMERRLTDDTMLAHIKASKSPQNNSFIELDQGFKITVVEKQGDLYLCKVNAGVYAMLNSIGHVPLPLYIDRVDEGADKERYQTVYAQHLGSAAAPTAGLHFDDVLLKSIQQLGVNIAYTTLHIGAGTFRPVRCENIVDHQMHKEWFVVSQELCEAVRNTKQNGGRVIAVGTTALRSLESAAQNCSLQAMEADTDIFIYPGYTFKVCDGLITNFHLPESTLIMLVAAFIGYEEAMQVYQTAVDAQYRFFSYGDACLFLRK